MVKITLTNQNNQSSCRKAVLDIGSKVWLLDDKEECNFTRLQKVDFRHPLLTCSVLKSKTTRYDYTYDNLDDMLNTAKMIYATLLQANHPQNCQFVITPSPKFFLLKSSYQIPFSLDHYKRAKNFITANQLDGLISQSSNSSFHFIDQLIIEGTISLETLPAEVNGDQLFEFDKHGYLLLTKNDSFDKYELRNINHYIGFGVYAREAIQKDEDVCLYLGIKKHNPDIKRYYFNSRSDALGMGTDAHYYSNIGRFVNHAPADSRVSNPDSRLLGANLKSKRYLFYGIELVAYSAIRNIAKGEQLLVDYGDEYFESNNEYRFSIDGHLKDSTGKLLKETYHEKLSILRVMAHNGITQAAYRLLKRPLIALSISLIVLLILYSKEVTI
ncbi:SET domain-containing protein-lysine N-methyltransferase [Legionella hackeliae]|uniref:SET domain-containing protein n=1 Tax=Legionella hackeliae TaxID=449 RepID=A0A0A8UUL6_LEGHA|nr:SET domain-containing protein-lysine N-methyltransferase [Legionella hackeliae]KTD13775.1 SET domain protein [Legionella hackeliae]CEK10474.1 protein of unknown function [SET domain] [Legionella hackeliae]STX47210.1 SET domain [Legionella hackeliae]